MYYLCLKCIQPDPNDRPTLDWLCIILKDLIITYEELNKWSMSRKKWISKKLKRQEEIDVQRVILIIIFIFIHYNVV